MLFYSTTYVGDIYIKMQATPGPHVEEEGTRLGSKALFYQSIAMLVANFVLPVFVWDPAGDLHAANGHSNSRKNSDQSLWEKMHIPDRFKIHLSLLWTLSHGAFFLCMMCTL